MFSTIQPKMPNYRDYTYTPLSTNRRRFFGQSQQISRPMTVNYQYFQSSSNQNQFKPFKTIDIAEIQLKRQFQKQIKLNPYLKSKIKQQTLKNQKNIYYARSFSKNQQNNKFTQDPESSYINHSTILSNHKINSPISIKQMKICTFLNTQSHKPIIVQKVIDQAIISNTKQKINRLIQMKKQQQEKFNLLKIKIKFKCQDNNNKDKKRRSLYDKTSHKMIQNQEWDQQWRQKLNKQSTRYRNRLINLHKKSVDKKIPGNIKKIQIQQNF